MKKILMSAAIVSMVFASCTNEEVIDRNTGGRLITLEVNRDVESRTALDEVAAGYQTIWSEGDQIYVTGEDGRTKGILTLEDSDAGKVSGKFKGYVFGNGTLKNAIFPVPMNDVVNLSNRIAGEIDAPMAGTINGNGVTLINKSAVIKLKVIDLPVNSTLKISGNNICTSATWNGSDFVAGSTGGEFVVTGTEAGEEIFVPVFVKNGQNSTNLSVKVGNGTPVNLTNVSVGTNKVSVNVPTLIYSNSTLSLASELVGDETENGEIIVNSENVDDILKGSNDDEIIKISLAEDVEVDVAAWSNDAIGGTSVKEVIIEGNGNTMTFKQKNSDWSNVTLGNDDAVLILKNVNISSTDNGGNGAWNNHALAFNCKVKMENVSSDWAIFLKKDAELNDVDITEYKGYYALYIRADVENVSISQFEISASRGIKIIDEYLTETKLTNLTISDAKFTTNEKSAILVTNYAGASINLSNVDITGVEADRVYAVWVDEERAQYDYLVSVTGGKKMIEGYAPGVSINKDNQYELSTSEAMFWFAEQVNEENNAFADKTVKLTANVDLKNQDWEPIGQTGATEFKGVFDGQNHTISNLNVDSETQVGKHYSSGLFGWIESSNNITIKNVKVNGAKVKGHHNVAVIAGYMEGNSTVSNCHVTGAQLSCTNANDDANGDKVGVIAGYAAGEVSIKDCSANASSISAGRDAGQIVGACKSSVVSNCTATNVTVSANGTSTGANIRNEVIGRVL